MNKQIISSLILILSSFNLLAAENAPNEPPYGNLDEDTIVQSELKGNNPIQTEERYSQPNSNEVLVEQEDVVRKSNSKKSKVYFIDHPYAAKGLIKIDKDGVYHYKTQKVSGSSRTGSFRIGVLTPPKISSSDGVSTYEDMYGSSNVNSIMFDYETKIHTVVGQMGLQYGLGFFNATGNGRFKDSTVQTADCTGSCQSQEKYNFFGIPLSVGLVYRLEVMKNQWFAPFVSAGGTYYALAEIRDDGQKNNIAGAIGGYGAAGGMINLSAINKDTGFVLDSEYGISNLWLTGELRVSKTFKEDVDLSSNTVSFGLSIDF